MAQAVVLCCRHSGGKRERIEGLTKDTLLADLLKKISNLTGIEPSRQKILLGFPPSKLNRDNGDKQSLDICGIKSGDTLTIEEEKAATRCAEELSSTSTKRRKLEGEQTRLKRHIVDSDNSCLFASLSFLIYCGEVKYASELRTLCADAIAKDYETYNSVMLGKDNESYCKWLRDSNSWGGAIEVTVFAKYFNVEIDIVDIQSGRIDQFGQNCNYQNRVFLLYDGIHYDPLFTTENSSTKTTFPIDDTSMLQDAKNLADDEKKKFNFTDLAKFSLQCTNCRALLTGQSDAQDHAKKTGHTSFGEVKK